MLHSLPELLNDLEQKLIAGEDPLPLLASVRWHEVIGWPQDRAQALALQVRAENLKRLVGALEAPVRVTLARLHPTATYAIRGGQPLPRTVSVRLHQSA